MTTQNNLYITLKKLFDAGRYEDILKRIEFMRTHHGNEIYTQYPHLYEIERAAGCKNFENLLAVFTYLVEEKLPFSVAPEISQQINNFAPKISPLFEIAKKSIRVNTIREIGQKSVIVFPCFFAGIGDWVLINQLMREEKAKSPECCLVAAVINAKGYWQAFRQVANLNPDIDELLLINMEVDNFVGINKFYTQKNKFGFNPVLWAEMVLLLSLKKYNVKKICKYSGYPRLLNHYTLGTKHNSQHLLDMEELVKMKNDSPCLVVPERVLFFANKIIKNINASKYIVLHLKSNEDFQIFWNVLKEICEKHNLKVVLISGYEKFEHQQADWFIDLSARKFRLEVIAAIIDKSMLFCGNISGPMHLAAALKKPIVSLYFREHTGLDWSPKQNANNYISLYKKAYDKSGEEIGNPLDYGKNNKNVSRFEQIEESELKQSILKFICNMDKL